MESETESKELALSRYMSNLNITLTLTSNRVIVIYSNTFRLLIYRESAKEFNLEELPTFLLYVLDEVEQICCEETTDLSKLESHFSVVDKVVGLLRELSFTQSVSDIIETNDLEHLKLLSDVFADILFGLQQLISILSVTPATVAENICVIDGRNHGEVGRLKFHITSEVLEDLQGLGFGMLGVSRWTIARRIRECGLENMCGFSPLSNEGLDCLVKSYIDQQGTTSGQTYIIGYVRSLGYCVQCSRIRVSSKGRSTKYQTDNYKDGDLWPSRICVD